MFTTNIGSDTVSVLSRGANPLAWTVTTIAVGKGPEAMAISPDGAELWVAHSRDGGVSVIDIATRKVAHTFDIRTKRSNRLAFTPDGAFVLVSDLDGGALVVIDAAARTEVKRIPLGRSPEGILVAPDGSRAYVAVTGDNAVAVIDLTHPDRARPDRDGHRPRRHGLGRPVGTGGVAGSVDTSSLAELGPAALLAATFAFAFVSGIIPFVLNIELYLLAVAALTDASLVPIVGLATAGQTIAKLILYLVGKGALNIKWVKKSAASKAADAFAKRPGSGLGIVALSAVVGFRPSTGWRSWQARSASPWWRSRCSS